MGINPSLRSAEVGHHFASPTNPFWRLLHAAKLIPEPIGADDDRRLREWGLALTNVCARPTRAAAELTRAELQLGARILRRKIEGWRPAVVALVGLGLYRLICPDGTSPGAGAKPERLSDARLFVLPNPSGLNASFPGFAHKLVWFKALADYLLRHECQPAVR